MDAQQQAVLLALFDTIDETVILVDRWGFICTVGSSARALLGCDPIGQKLSTLLHLYSIDGGTVDISTLCPPDGSVSVVNGYLQQEANRRRDVHVRARVVVDDPDRKMVIIIRDLSEIHRVQEEVLRARKLESITRLASRIAHDFNNQMTGIITNLFVAKMDPAIGGETYELFQEAERAAFQASALARQLLSLAPSDQPVLVKQCLRSLIEETVQMMSRGSSVSYELTCVRDLRPVCIDGVLIDQALRSILCNAEEAMNGMGTILIDVRETKVSPVSEVPPLDYGEYVCIAITDEGSGIRSEHLSEIFDPFFTTKKNGKGIGLSAAFSAVAHHGGHITVESLEGTGTTFCLYLPIAEGEADLHVSMHENDARGVKVLIMDDDPMIQSGVERVLTSLGYDATVCRSGEEALVLYSDSLARGRVYDVVILDLTVYGGMGGRETMERLIALDPDVCAIVSSGFAYDEVLEKYEHFGFKGVAAKPYRIEDLHHLISRIRTRR